jgi:F-type H+-transporting ATPase subunit d
MVDDFQKKYESLQVPYPKDTMTSLIENQSVEHKSAYEKFVKESKSRYNYNAQFFLTFST